MNSYDVPGKKLFLARIGGFKYLLSMKNSLLLLTLGLVYLVQFAVAVPTTFGGGGFAQNHKAPSPLDGMDLTSTMLAAATWSGESNLPGEWIQEAVIGGTTVSQLYGKPKMFGRDVLLLRAWHRGNVLESLEATFVDAGSYFGFFNEQLPKGLTKKQKRDEIQTRTAISQEKFSILYKETLAAVEKAIDLETNATSSPAKVGHSRVLRAQPLEWKKDNISVRLLASDQRLIRVTLQPQSMTSSNWMDRSLIKETSHQRLDRLAACVVHRNDDAVAITGLQPIEQGWQPYCGLSALGMVARYFGMQVDEAWLAAAGGFQNTGSANGSKMLELYNAVAAEAGFGLNRQSKLDEMAMRHAIDSGLPVIVWRRYSQERDIVHSKFMVALSKSPNAILPDPNDAQERASWPSSSNPSAPLHASVVCGYQPDRKEVLFLDSWSGKDVPRRMRIEELADTTYLCFIFKP